MACGCVHRDRSLCLSVQFDFEAVVSKTFASMNEITLDLDSGKCSMRKLAEEPRCEFPVVPDRLLGEPILPLCALGDAPDWILCTSST